MSVQRIAHLYDYPRFYDVAGGPERTGYLEMLDAVFEEQGVAPPAAILEAACGPTRLGRRLAAHGYRVSAYDLNPAMLDYAQAQARAEGLEITLYRADMVDPPRGPFDMVINPSSSLSYLLEDKAVEAHRDATAASLRPGGLYLVELQIAREGIPRRRASWEAAGQGCSLRAVVTLSEDPAENCFWHHTLMEIRDGDDLYLLDELNRLRLWRAEDFLVAMTAGGLFKFLAQFQPGQAVDQAAAHFLFQRVDG